MTRLVEEESTLEWAGLSFEQGLFQWLIRIAQISGVSFLLPLLSGNAGWMVAENLSRREMHFNVAIPDRLLCEPIQSALEFGNHMRTLPLPLVFPNKLQPPAVVHLFGHLKNEHMMLRMIIYARVRHFFES